jgi:hypothetical protein
MSIDPTVDRPRLCAHTFDDGRRCRTPHRSGHTLCHFHARKEAETLARQAAAAKISYDLSGECIAFRDVSAAIAHTISAVAHGHIKHKAATTIAYLCQSLVQSAARAESEHIRTFGIQDWKDEVIHTFNTSRFAEPKLSSDLDPAEPDESEEAPTEEAPTEEDRTEEAPIQEDPTEEDPAPEDDFQEELSADTNDPPLQDSTAADAPAPELESAAK